MGNVFFEMTMSLDGFITRPNVDIHQPFGDDGDSLHDWMFSEPTPMDRQIAAEMNEKTGAFVMGRRMFDFGEEPWGDDTFVKPCFVLTNRPKAKLVKGAATFTFITNGIHSALEQARQAAGEQDICIVGGADVGQQYLRAGLVDELRLHVAPVLFGAGTRLFENIGTDKVKLEKIQTRETPNAMHLVYRISK